MPGRLKKCCHVSSPTGRHIGGLILSLVAAHHTSAEEPKAEAFPGRDRLKPLQTVTAGPPPASPADFSPDTGDPLAFPLRLFTNDAGEWTHQLTLSLGTPPLPPGALFRSDRRA